MTNLPRMDAPRVRSTQAVGIAVTVLLHVGAIALLLQFESVRKALVEATPLMVTLITPPAPRLEMLPKPLPVQPKVQPKPIQPQQQQTQPQLPAPSEAPAMVSAPPPPPPSPAPPIEAPVVAQAVASAPPAPPAPAPVVPVAPPNFNADYLRNPPPVYPSLSKRQGHQGKVTLRVLVNAGGGADQVLLHQSSGHDLLDSAAQAAVRRWRFVPARQGDQPVAEWVLVPITFTLES